MSINPNIDEGGSSISLTVVALMALIAAVFTLPNDVFLTDSEVQEAADRQFEEVNLASVDEIRRLITTCEAELPRNETCKLVAVQKIKTIDVEAVSNG